MSETDIHKLHGFKEQGFALEQCSPEALQQPTVCSRSDQSLDAVAADAGGGEAVEAQPRRMDTPIEQGNGRMHPDAIGVCEASIHGGVEAAAESIVASRAYGFGARRL